MNKKLLTTVVLILGLLAFGAWKSNLLITTATVEYSTNEESPLAQREIRAPYGFEMIELTVYPANSSDDRVYTSYSNSVRTKLWGRPLSRSTEYPTTGKYENIPTETLYKISDQIDRAATSKVPEDRSVLERCGTYIYLTKSKKGTELESDIAKW